MIDNHAQHDALSRAIFEALEGARAVADAFSRIESNGDLDWERQEPLCEVLRGNLDVDNFSERAVRCLRAMAEGIEPAIALERRTSIHFDECCTSDYWEEVHMTGRGHALYDLHEALIVLANRISTVLDLKKTEKLAASLTV